MTAILPYVYACALKDAGYPQPEFAEGQMWYNSDTGNHGEISASFMYACKHYPYFSAIVEKARLIYAPGYVELAKATKTHVPAFLTEQELADIWLAQNRKR
jgi:hypothetical protein